jgi:hypothetical protein
MRPTLLLILAAAPGFLSCSIVFAAEPPRETATVSGIVVDGKGVAVAGVKVEALLDRSIVAALSDALGKFQLAVPKNRVAGLAIFATAPNGIGMLRVFREDAAASPFPNLRIELVESRSLEVSVTDENKRPIAEARVSALVGQFELPFRETGAQGKASLQLPVRARYLAIFADKAERGLDYCVLELVRRHADARGWPDDGRLSLTLGPTRKVTIRAKGEDGRPLPGIELQPEFLAKPSEPAGLYLSSMPGMCRSATNSEGIASFDLPTWVKTRVTFWPRDGKPVPRRIVWDPAKRPDGIIDAVIPRPVEVSGRVEFANGAPAAGIGILVCGAGYDIEWFQGRTTSRADGRFAIDVYPDQLDMLGIDDKKWGAPAIDSVVVKRSTPIRNLKFTLQPAARIYGRVVLGKDRKPLADQFLTLQQEGRDLGSLKGVKLPNPDDMGFYVAPSLSLRTATDREGRYEFHVGPGQYTLTGPPQVEPKRLSISTQAEVKIDFEAIRPEKGRLLGQVLDARSHQPVPRATILGIYRSPQAVGDVQLVADDNGKFIAERQLFRVVLYARSPDGKLAGIVELGPDDRGEIIQVEPTGNAVGQIINLKTRAPLVKVPVKYSVRVQMENANGWRPSFGGETTTDEQGKFEIKSLVAGSEYDIDVPSGKDTQQQVGTAVVDPGKTKQLGQLTFQGP